MNNETINLVYFSPTRSTQKILEAIAKGIAAKQIEKTDLTTDSSNKTISIGENSLTIIGVPVYGGRVPEIAAKRLKNIAANNSPAIVVVVYGNRDFDDALLELSNISVSCGFKTIAAGAFIGEHSYSTIEKQIAFGRPDKNDIQIAENFGKKLLKKLNEPLNSEKDAIIIPGNYPYKDINRKPFLAPDTNQNKCILCGKCIDVCPTGAITLSDKIYTDNEKCIWCFACVKYCDQGARTMDNDIVNKFRNSLVENCNDRKEPVLFVG